MNEQELNAEVNRLHAEWFVTVDSVKLNEAISQAAVAANDAVKAVRKAEDVLTAAVKVSQEADALYTRLSALVDAASVVK